MSDMSRWSTGMIACFMALSSAAPVAANEAEVRDGAIVYTSHDSFEDVSFAVESAIVDRGLSLDAISNLGKALERNRVNNGEGREVFREADVYSFCPATVASKVTEDNFLNIRFCPYSIFVFTRAEEPGVTRVGFNDYPDDIMQNAENMLEAIVRDALELD